MPENTTVQSAPNAEKPKLIKSRKVYVETQGCQMNLNDSELMLGLLSGEGFEPTSEIQQADLIILNTCQIRSHSEEKAFSYAGSWKKLKAKNPDLKIAMAGCVAQQNKAAVFKRVPHVDIVFGTQNIQDLPELVRRSYGGETQVLKVDRQRQGSTYDYTLDVAAKRESDISAWVTIIEGCDYFCTYCVVPYTRGRQVSRSPESILREVNQLASHGFKEITLLGQTVDSYGKDFTEGSDKAAYQGYGLANLLTELNEIPGLERIRFMTSHPLDLNDAIIEAVATLPKVMEYIHIPMQAGDTEVLQRMKRGYTAEQYFELVDKLHARIPDVAVSGDFIVGFPGETDEQFQRTVESVVRGNIDNANTAVYSPRKQTPAGLWEERGEQVPDNIKDERLKILNAAIADQGLKKNKQYEGRTLEVLVEGPSKRNPSRLTGRTRNNKVVNFETTLPEHVLVGQCVPITLTEAYAFSLMGVMAPETEAPFLNVGSAVSSPFLAVEPVLVS